MARQLVAASARTTGLYAQTALTLKTALVNEKCSVLVKLIYMERKEVGIGGKGIVSRWDA